MPETPLDLLIVLLNYRTPAMTLACLRSLAGQIDPGRQHVVVVDNASGDDSLERIGAGIEACGWGDWASLLGSPVNGGFSAGNNLGLRWAKARRYLLLNSDTELPDGTLAELNAVLDRHPGVGIVGPSMVNGAGVLGATAFRNITPLSELVSGASTGPLTRLLGRAERPERNETVWEPDWIAFACVLIRREVIDEVGLMDEGYFMYFEDIDYCRRVRRAGWRILFWPQARIVHLAGGSAPSSDKPAAIAARPRYFYEGRARYFASFYGLVGLWAANLLWSAGHALFLARRRITGLDRLKRERVWKDIWTHCLDPFRPSRSRPAEASHPDAALATEEERREPMEEITRRVGVVAIGRNEGERMLRCMRSVLAQTGAVVYVDSGSTDGSVEKARDLGAVVVELDTSRPFTAARGRNAGFAELVDRWPDLEYVQFVDGDCELQPGWIETATAFLDAHPEVAVACGRRRERFPDDSIYNRLTDLEWDTPIGRSHMCGGDALMRVRVLRSVGLYDAGLIAGEDPELCLRIRRAGYAIERLDREMTLHDAAIFRFGQWWQRQVRSGHAYAELLQLQGRTAERHYVRKFLSLMAWGAVLPLVCLAAAPFTLGASLLALPAAFVYLTARIHRDGVASGREADHARAYAAFTALGKLAEAQGALKFAWNRWVRGRRSGLIEYK